MYTHRERGIESFFKKERCQSTQIMNMIIINLHYNLIDLFQPGAAVNIFTKLVKLDYSKSQHKLVNGII